ncbi:MAG: universal stress protein [Acidobacteria bacterium]|nr:universal stress protein [Acidobacteriota bacterium]
MTHGGTVVGWDGSAGADAALEWAAQREEPCAGALHIVRALRRDEPGEPSDRVAAAQRSLHDAVRDVVRRHPRIAVTAELVLGDPLAELARIAGDTAVLVLGASAIGRSRRPDDRRLPIAAVARHRGITAIVPAAPPGDRSGVIAVVVGRDHSRFTIDFAARSAADSGEPLTLVRLHDPHDAEVRTRPVDLDPAVQRLHAELPELEVRVDPHWVGSPMSLLARSDRAALLVLEGYRSSVAPPRYSLERWLAGQARAPFVVVAEGLVDPEADAAQREGRRFVLAG